MRTVRGGWQNFIHCLEAQCFAHLWWAFSRVRGAVMRVWLYWKKQVGYRAEKVHRCLVSLAIGINFCHEWALFCYSSFCMYTTFECLVHILCHLDKLHNNYDDEFLRMLSRYSVPCVLFWCVLQWRKVALLLSAYKFCFLGVTSIYLGPGNRNRRMTTRYSGALKTDYFP